MYIVDYDVLHRVAYWRRSVGWGGGGGGIGEWHDYEAVNRDLE